MLHLKLYVAHLEHDWTLKTLQLPLLVQQKENLHNNLGVNKIQSTLRTFYKKINTQLSASH